MIAYRMESEREKEQSKNKKPAVVAQIGVLSHAEKEDLVADYEKMGYKIGALVFRKSSPTKPIRIVRYELNKPCYSKTQYYYLILEGMNVGYSPQELTVVPENDLV